MAGRLVSDMPGRKRLAESLAALTRCRRSRDRAPAYRRSWGVGSSVRAGGALCTEHVCCGGQSFARAVDQQGRAQFRLEGAGSLIVSGLESVEEHFHERFWPVDLEIVIRVRDEVQAIAAWLLVRHTLVNSADPFALFLTERGSRMSPRVIQLPKQGDVHRKFAIFF